jgi:hypothetical protein
MNRLARIYKSPSSMTALDGSFLSHCTTQKQGTGDKHDLGVNVESHGGATVGTKFRSLDDDEGQWIHCQDAAAAAISSKSSLDGCSLGVGCQCGCRATIADINNNNNNNINNNNNNMLATSCTKAPSGL